MDMQRKQKTHVAAESGELTTAPKNVVSSKFEQPRNTTLQQILGIRSPNDIHSGKPSPPPSDFCLFVFGNTATLSRTQQDGDNSHVRWEKQQSVG